MSYRSAHMSAAPATLSGLWTLHHVNAFHKHAAMHLSKLQSLLLETTKRVTAGHLPLFISHIASELLGALQDFIIVQWDLKLMASDAPRSLSFQTVGILSVIRPQLAPSSTPSKTPALPLMGDLIPSRLDGCCELYVCDPPRRVIN